MGGYGRDIIENCRLSLTAPLYYILITNGYPRKQSLDLILSRPDIAEPGLCRNLMNRCIHPAQLNSGIRSKRVDPGKIEKLAVDFLNVTATLYAALKGDPHLLAQRQQVFLAAVVVFLAQDLDAAGAVFL